LYVFFGFAIFVLLVAVTNVAGLQLVRAVGRQRECAVRMALGAGRLSLLKQSLTEVLWIAVPGAGIGALAASWQVDLIRSAIPAGSLVRAGGISMDWRALIFVMGASLAIALLVALAPVLLARSTHIDAVLREDARTVSAAPRTQRLLNGLI